jgi:hypothetical protein
MSELDQKSAKFALRDVQSVSEVQAAVVYRAFGQRNFFGVRDAVRLEHLVSDFRPPFVVFVAFVQKSCNLVVNWFWLRLGLVEDGGA